MNEALLHTIWKYKLLGTVHFTGTKQETIEVISIGEHNKDAGPDFFNSKVKINDIVLAGNVELHLKTSDWLKHNHQKNKAYDNLILHVVFEHDIDLPQNEQFNVSVVELKHLIKPSLIEQYQQIEFSKHEIPCGKAITEVPGLVWKSWLDRLAISRIEEKTNYVESLFNYCKQNYEDTLYVLLCRNFGFKINSSPFELLGKSMPYSILKKYADQPLQIEALLFGVGGFLNEPYQDAFPKLLQNEFEFLKHKYQLQVIQKENWKFSKTRPANFPTIRISQFANLIYKQESLYHLLERKPSIAVLKKWFEIQTSSYWQTHFMFDTEVPSTHKMLGETSFNHIVINTIVPFLFFMEKHQAIPQLMDYALELLSQLPPEENIKTKRFESLGVKTENALESQAQIQLFDSFCSMKGCIDCRVAEHLLKRSA